MICSTGGRWPWGLRRMNRRPVLGTMLTPPAPIDDMNCSTYGSLRTIAATACCFSRMASNEMSWAASVNAMREKQQRSEEHTSELQSRLHLVCRLLLEKKKKNSK